VTPSETSHSGCEMGSSSSVEEVQDHLGRGESAWPDMAGPKTGVDAQPPSLPASPPWPLGPARVDGKQPAPRKSAPDGQPAPHAKITRVVLKAVAASLGLARWEKMSFALLHNRQLQGCVVAAAYFVPAVYFDMSTTHWFNLGAFGVITCLILLATCPLHFTMRAVYLIFFATQVYTLSTRAFAASPSEMLAGMERTAHNCGAITAFALCMGGWLGGQPLSIFTVRAKLLYLAAYLTLRLVGFGAMAAHTGNRQLAGFVALCTDLSFSSSFLLAARYAHSSATSRSEACVGGMVGAPGRTAARSEC
jgi:hypothetical protein